MKPLTSFDLDNFVLYVDQECNGNPNDPRVLDRFGTIAFDFETPVDQSLDPFGENYFQAQTALYQEIAGRPLDQSSGELHPVNVDSLLNCANPLGSNDVNTISDNVRIVSSMLSLCNLDSGARILDMGAGHGLSSEIYAFCGCRVSAVDIDPVLGDLAVQRAQMRSLSVQRLTLNFDCLASIQDDAFSAAFFFQSFHHALRPWLLIDELSRKLVYNGVIAFSGEPIQELWWKNWGIRLDGESLYVARKLGWFESGWSLSFLKDCFARNGMELLLFGNESGGSSFGVASKSPQKLAQIAARADKLGFAQPINRLGTLGVGYHSQIGYLKRDFARPMIQAFAQHLGGFLHYGPYTTLGPGQYSVSFLLRFMDPEKSAMASSTALFDIVSSCGSTEHVQKVIELRNGAPVTLINVQLCLNSEAQQIEARVRIPQPGEIWEMSLPVFEKQMVCAVM